MNDPLVLETFLPYRISRLAERVSRSLSQVYSERFGISVPQWRILATLAEAPGLTAQRVAACTNMDKVKVSRAVAELESRGHLRRERSARDGRASDLHLTDEGRRLFRRIAPLARAWEQQFLSSLSAAEQTVFFDFLERLEGGIE
jgi:DNA-binding MarR family transcriptional regulator